MQKLTEHQVEALIDTGEASAEIRNASSRVALVLTQSWCPDWTFMRSFIEGANDEGLTIFYCEYDREPFFRELMEFKESVLGNSLIPYVRYYADGMLVGDGNGEASLERFLGRFEGV